MTNSYKIQDLNQFQTAQKKSLQQIIIVCTDRMIFVDSVENLLLL